MSQMTTGQAFALWNLGMGSAIGHDPNGDSIAEPTALALALEAVVADGRGVPAVLHLTRPNSPPHLQRAAELLRLMADAIEGNGAHG